MNANSWRWTYGIGSIYGVFVVFMIATFGQETYVSSIFISTYSMTLPRTFGRMYDRKLPNPRPIPRPESALRYRLETLVGLTGARMSKYRDTWRTAVFSILNVVWRPHLLMILLFEAAVFGFSIGINVSLAFAAEDAG